MFYKIDSCWLVRVEFERTMRSRHLVVSISWLLVAIAVSRTDGVRLPRHFLPRHYTLRLLPRILDVTDYAAIDGVVQIDIQCLQNTRVIVLNAVDV